MSISNMSIEQSRIQNIAEDYKKHGETSILAKILKKLNS